MVGLAISRRVLTGCANATADAGRRVDTEFAGPTKFVTVAALFVVSVLPRTIDVATFAADLRATLLIVAPFGCTYVAEWYHARTPFVGR